LYSRYIPLIYGVALKYLGNADSTKDAVKTLFDNILPTIDNSEIPVFRTWIYSVLKTHLQILRKENIEIFVDLNENIVENGEILQLLTEKNEQDERFPKLKASIKKLPVEQRVSILRFFYEEMSYQDIADGTNYGLAKVKNYVQNGIKNLNSVR
jgi:RNA polymerase sigma-70 factor (ECF subfamily)